MNELFDDIVYLNLEARADRRARMERELAQHNITARRVSASVNEDPTISFNISQLNILKSFLRSEHQSILVLEDDVLFLPEISNVARSLRDLRGRRWSAIYLGANLYDFPFEFVTPRLVRVRGAWCTHAVAYSRAGAKQILEGFAPVFDQWTYDDWLAKVYLPAFDSIPGYLVFPMIAEQVNGISDLMKGPVDYSECWRITRGRLQKAFNQYR